MDEKNENNNKNLKVNKSCSDLFHKDFEYPFLNRKDLMSLSTINSNDFPIKKFKQMVTNRDWSLNLYNLDIEGSSPRKFGLFSNKIDFTNKNKDIEKSSPYTQKILKKPNYNLSNEDIEGSRPNISQCNKLSRHTNPLEPKYNLPKLEKIQIEDKTKFIRDNSYIGDISEIKNKKQNIFLRDTLNKNDLIDSFPKKQYFTRKDKYNNMDYTDVTKINNKIQRCLNPLMPIYNWKYPINNLRYSVGPIEGNKPNPFSMYKYENPFNLRNDDIDGTNPGSKNTFKKFKGSNSCLNIGDIRGAIHGSLKKGITTKRNINPIWPKYEYPGENELKNEKKSLNKNENIKFNKIEKNISIELTNLNNKLQVSNENSFNIDDNNGKQNIQNENNDNTKKDNKTKNEERVKICKALSELNGVSPNNNNEVKFDKNLYKKPEIYYPFKHEKYIIPQIKDYNKNSTQIPKVRSFQQVVNERIRFTNQLKNLKVNNLSKNTKKSYENKMDDFFVKSTINNFKLQQRIKNNLNAYYDIGFPEELKTSDFDHKF